MRRRRVWCELLPPEELGGRATLDLLSRHTIEPLIALPPKAETEEMGKALRALSERGIGIGLWPLLDDADGYWASARNARAFSARVEAAIGFAARAGARVRTVAVDLEPPLSDAHALFEGELTQRARTIWDAVREAADRRQAEDAASVFSAVASGLAARRIETLAAVLPPVVLDLASGLGLFERLLGTPVRAPSWAVVSPMMYTSLLERIVASRRIARAILYQGSRLLVRARGRSGSSVSLGLVGAGKLGSEPALGEPSDLARDAALASAAGIEDVALYSLEGLLSRADPEAWLYAAFGSDPRPA